MAYKRRIVDEQLKFKLQTKGAVLIEGAKWCGKTTTAEQVAGSVLNMDDPATTRQNLRMAEMDPSILLQGETPRLIDEWQLAPNLWDAVRYTVDHRSGMGQFILTGSSVPPDMTSVHHSGVGRFARLRMRPMTLFESGESNGEVSLRSLFEDSVKLKSAPAKRLSLNDIAFAIARGGWPMSMDMNGDAALAQARDYLDVVVSSDMSRFDSVERSESKARALLRSYARNVGGAVPATTIMEDVAPGAGRSGKQAESSLGTIRSYINVLKGIFVLEDLEAWSPNLRSKSAIRTSPTRYFTDPSIAAAALRVGPEDLLSDLVTMGFLFENMCVRDLRVYADALDGDLYHYRDKSGLECDAVMHLRNGKYGLVEVKLGGNSGIEDGIKSLLALSGKLDEEKMNSPSFLMVLTAIGDYAYLDASGVHVVPIGALGL